MRLKIALLGLLVSTGLFGQTGARYLIIAADTFGFPDIVQPLADWKTQKGMLAKTVRLSEIGHTADSIRNYIIDAYNNWEIPPEYVLLVGAPRYLPASRRARTRRTDTDDGYGDLVGDYELEIPVGRFFCFTARECSTLVVKALNYEREPYLSGDSTWLKKALSIRREDSPPYPNWVYYRELLYLMSVWGGAGFTTIDTLVGRRVENVWVGDSSPNVRASINDGRGIVVYRGSTTSNWWDPFSRVSPNTLTNGDRTPIVLSGSCFTITLDPFDPRMIGDSFVRAGTPDSRRGAVAYFGTTTTGAGVERSETVRGFMTAAFSLDMGPIGDCAKYGKHIFRQLYPTDTITYEEWVLLGDPEMPVHSDLPGPLHVVCSEMLRTGQDTLFVEVTRDGRPVNNTLVCARDTTGAYAWGYTAADGRLALPIRLTRNGEVQVTATAHNCLPWSDFVPVRTVDFGTTAILAPSGTADSGMVYIPRARVRNLGTVDAAGSVRFRIGDGYQSVIFKGVAVGAESTFSFAPWSPGRRGLHAVVCSTGISHDFRPENDTATGSVTIRVRDAAGLRVLAPLGVLDSGQTALPVVRVRNAGSEAVSFGVRLRIGAYSDLQSVTNLAPGESTEVTFALWTANERGSGVVRCSTLLSNDANPGNDLVTGNVRVRVFDAGTKAILSPTPNTPPGAVPVRVVVRNFGTERQPLDVVFRIGPGSSYAHTITLTNGLTPEQDTLLEFDPWTAVEGAYVAQCSTRMPGDQAPGNDRLIQPVLVSLGDAGVTSIVSPQGAVDSAVTVAPACEVRNYGDDPATFRAFCALFDEGSVRVYFESTLVSALAPGTTVRVGFQNWPAPHAVGLYTVRCSTALPGDLDPENDVLAGGFSVVPGAGDTGWTARAEVPAGDQGKKVKDGAALAYSEAAQAQAHGQTPSSSRGEACAEGSGSGHIYAFKGNNRPEFYQYDIETNTWTTRESIPAVGSSGKKKLVKKGASLAAHDGKIYGTKGNNTLEHWRYDPHAGGAYPWTQLPDVPAGGRTIREGSGQVTVGDHIYFLKGSGTTEFYRWTPTTGVWETMTNAPAGLSGKPFKNGSSLCYDGANTIYLLKGSYGEFFGYRVDSGTWTTLPDLPKTGSTGRKKVKDGSSTAFLGGTVYALKGGNTVEFWSYRVDSGRWTEIASMPLGIGKKVKGGGAVVSDGTALYALKGNSTLEFYRFGPAAGHSLQPAASSPNALADFTTRAASFTLQATPNPFSGSATITYSLPAAGRASLKLYDINGDLVSVLSNGYRSAGRSSLILQHSALASGVYLLRLETGQGSSEQKLVVK
jgi:hypothetical protein